MKIKNILAVAFFISTFFIACKKNELATTEYTLPVDKAMVRLAFFSPTVTTTSVMIKVNDVKLNGAFTNISAGFFPTAVLNSDYAAVPPNATFKLSIPNTATSNDSVVLFTSNFGGVEANKFYTLILTDTGVNRTGFRLDDSEAQNPDSGFVSLRFANAVPNAPINIIRIDSANPTTVVRDTILRNIAFKSASAFTRISLASAVTPASAIRFRAVTGTGGAVPAGIVIGNTAPGLVNRRVATIFATGFAAGATTWASAFGNSMTNK